MSTTLEEYLKSKIQSRTSLRYYVPEEMQKLFNLPPHLDLIRLFFLSSIINPELEFTQEMKEYLKLDERFDIFIGAHMCDIDGIKYWTQTRTPFKTETVVHDCQPTNKIFSHFLNLTDNILTQQIRYNLHYQFSYYCKDEECKRWSDLQKELIDKFMSELVLPVFSDSKWKILPPFDNVFEPDYKLYIVCEEYENRDYDSDQEDGHTIITDFDTLEEAIKFIRQTYETIYSTNSQDEEHFIQTIQKLNPKLLSNDEFNSWNFPNYFIEMNHAKIKNEELK